MQFFCFKQKNMERMIDDTEIQIKFASVILYLFAHVLIYSISSQWSHFISPENIGQKWVKSKHSTGIISN